MLVEEISKFDHKYLENIAEIWGIKGKISTGKKSFLEQLRKVAMDDYSLRGVLEKLTPIQVQIYNVIINNKNILTLGEISRKVQMQPINVEKELNVLRQLMLVYLRKNRKRITNNLDRYYPFEEIRNRVSTDTNEDGGSFKLSLKKNLEKLGLENLDSKYISAVGSSLELKEFINKALDEKTLAKIFRKINEKESRLIDEVFKNGGILEINSARTLLNEQKLNPEKTLRKLSNLKLIEDIYFIEERFVRVLVLSYEIFNYLEQNPIFPKEVGVKELNAQKVSNQFDFILNIKKLLLFISKKGLTLAQSEKIKQIDLKKSESNLINIDIRLFREKSQIHQLEVILPFLKIFDLVDIKNEDIILRPCFESILKKDPLELTKELLDKTAEASEKRMVGKEIFLPLELPFYKKEVLLKCVHLIKKHGSIYTKILLARTIRDSTILSSTFKLKDFRNIYLKQWNSMVSALFYMHVFGLIVVEYPKRKIQLSEIGEHFFFSKKISTKSSLGSLWVNPDSTVIAMPDKLSIFDLHLLKSFTTIKDSENVYSLQINKEAVQEGVLLGNSATDFKNFLQEYSRNKIPQNILFSIKNWTSELPIVNIEEGVVLLETSSKKLKDLLVGQIKSQKIILKEISPTAMVIAESKIPEVIAVAEKLEMIVKLIR